MVHKCCLEAHLQTSSQTETISPLQVIKQRRPKWLMQLVLTAIKSNFALKHCLHVLALYTNPLA